MGLLNRPRTRPRTYVDGTPLDPNDMDEIFDALIADAQWPKNVSALRGMGTAASYTDGTTYYGFIKSTGAGEWLVPIDGLDAAGQSIARVRFEAFGTWDGTSGVTLDVHLWVRAKGGATAPLGTISLPATLTPAWHAEQIDISATPHPIAEGDELFLTFKYDGADIQFGGISVDNQ